MKHKLVTRGARKDSNRLTGALTKSWKQLAHRIYRRRVRQMDHEDEAVNYEPRGKGRITAYDVA